MLGTNTVDPAYISYFDGFFTFPVQTIRTSPRARAGRTTAFEIGQDLGAYTSFVDTSVLTPAVTRELMVTGGFGNNLASNDDPKAFVYEFDSSTFPNIPLIQPRLDSVEEMEDRQPQQRRTPMHVHVNDFQVMQIVDPVAGTTTGVQPWGQDNVNVPAPVIDANENPLVPATTTIRTKFTEFTGTFVIHRHRQPRGQRADGAGERDPAVSSYAVAVPGSRGTPPGRGARRQRRSDAGRRHTVPRVRGAPRA